MFTYNIQYAGYDYSRYDEKGTIDLHSFLNVIDEFPWIEQMEKYQELQQGCSPTVYAVNSNTGDTLWISMAGDKQDYIYLIGFVYLRTLKLFLGLGKEENRKWVDI